jgi:hypothetical protein
VDFIFTADASDRLLCGCIEGVDEVLRRRAMYLAIERSRSSGTVQVEIGDVEQAASEIRERLADLHVFIPDGAWSETSPSPYRRRGTPH